MLGHLTKVHLNVRVELRECVPDFWRRGTRLTNEVTSWFGELATGPSTTKNTYLERIFQRFYDSAETWPGYGQLFGRAR